MKTDKSRTIVILCVVLALCVCAGLCLGSVKIPVLGLFNSIFGAHNQWSVIVWSLRLPRVLGCMITGTALAVSGLLLQRVTANELASPNVIGVNSGAGAAVMLVLCLFPGKLEILPFAAFVGAFGAVLLVLGISSKVRTHMTSATLVLSGIAVGSLLSALISFLSQLYPDVLASYVTFSAGGFSSVRMRDLYIPAVMVVVCFVMTKTMAGQLNLLVLGDDMARNLGVNVKQVKFLSLLLASVMTGASVSYAGLVGFVGLMVPHISARLCGTDAKTLIPSCALTGSIMVLLADIIGRTVFAPSEIPAGIILSFIGAPFFVYLLFRKGGHHAY